MAWPMHNYRKKIVIALTKIGTINMVLQPVNEFCEPYVDDIAVHSDNWKIHLQHLDVLQMYFPVI